MPPRIRRTKKIINRSRKTLNRPTTDIDEDHKALQKKLHQKIQQKQRSRLPKSNNNMMKKPIDKRVPQQIRADRLVQTILHEMGIHDPKVEQRVIQRLKQNPPIHNIEDVKKIIQECL